jgi:cytochrome b6-f complex subunit 5
MGETRGKQALFEETYPVVEPLLSGIVLGLIPVTLIGLFVAAYLQYKRDNQFGG